MDRRPKIKHPLVCRATPTQGVVFIKKEFFIKQPHIRIFGRLMRIRPQDLPEYQSFKIIWL